MRLLLPEKCKGWLSLLNLNNQHFKNSRKYNPTGHPSLMLAAEWDAKRSDDREGKMNVWVSRSKQLAISLTPKSIGNLLLKPVLNHSVYLKSTWSGFAIQTSYFKFPVGL